MGSSNTNLSGAKESGTAVWINDRQVVSADNKTTWSCQVSLTQGQNILNIAAYDLAGNKSPVVIKTITVDSVSPRLNSASVINKTTVELSFSEDITSADSAEHYLIAPSLGSFLTAKKDSKVYQLIFTQSIPYNTLYTVKALGITDTAGNLVDTAHDTAQFQRQAVERIYIYHNNKRIAMEENGVKYFYLHDHLGSTNVVTDENGKQIEHYEYTAYGDTQIEEGSLDVAKKFTGKELDDSTGLYDYGARMYDPKIGRFITPDTINPNLTNPQSLNRYSYCLNNPLKYVDPNGHYAVLLEILYLYAIAVVSSPDFQMDLDQLQADAMTGDGFGMVIDAVSVAIPGLYAGVAKKGIEAGSNILSGAANAVSGMKAISTAGDVGKAAKTTLRQYTTQIHHFFSNINKTFTPQFKEILSKYGLDLKGAWNKGEVTGHLGRHTNEYHEFMLRGLREANTAAKGVKDIFVKEIDKLIDSVKKNPEILYMKKK